MKILFIDTESFPSHINFNRIHITRLISEGHEVYGIFRKGYVNSLQISGLKSIYEIPDGYYERGKETRIKGRILYLRRLLNIRKFVNVKKYEAIIFSYYDETVFPFAFFPHGLYLINHVNVGGLHYKLKLLLYKLISRWHHQITLTKDSTHYLTSLGVQSHYIHHGVPANYNCNLSRPEWMKHKHNIFSPSATSSDIIYISKLISNQKFIDFLADYDIQFIVRSKDLHTIHKNVKIIDYYMSEAEYQACFIHSDLIFISYKTSFKYRASGILWECIANNKYVLIHNIQGLKEYTEIFGEDCFFVGIDDLISKAKSIILNNAKRVYNLEDLSPDYYFLNYYKN